MKSFNYAGETMHVHAEVREVRADEGVVVVAIRCESSAGVTVGPGTVEVTLPRREEAA
jgi:acyl dehydratase